MSVETTDNRTTHAGNGATTAFSHAKYFQSDSDLVVIVRNNTTGVETTKTLTTHYTISGTKTNGVYEDGGTVTMSVAPASGETLIIYADPSKTQGTDLVENDPMPAEVLEQSLDKLTVIAQRLGDRMDRAVRLTDGNAQGFDPKLPALITADRVLITNASATGFEMGPTAESIEDAEANATAAATSASAAAASASSASTSATNAATSATAAAASAVAAAAVASLPMTTKGDLLVYSGTQNLRLAAGANLYVPIYDSSETSGIRVGPVVPADGSVTRAKLATGAVAKRAIQTQSAAFTASTDYDTYLCNAASASFDVTLPSTVTGHTFTFTKINTVFDKTVQLVGTINGISNTKLHSPYETVVLQATSSTEYVIVQRYIPAAPVSYTPTLSSGFGTTTNSTFFYERRGAKLYVSGVFRTGTVSTGLGTISLPSGVTIASTLSANSPTLVGFLGISGASAGTWGVLAEPSGTTVAISFSNGANALLTKLANVNTVVPSTTYVSMWFEIPVDGWNG